jgi:hypothetical protein
MSLFQNLIADTVGPRSYLVVIEPFDPELGGVTELRFSDRGFTTGPLDTPANTYYAPRLVTPLNFKRELFSSGRVGGRSFPGFGVLALNNADGGLDDLAGFAFDGRRVRVYLGGDGFSIDDFGLIFDGTAEQIEFDDALVTVRLRDLQSKLDVDIQRASYGGTGGLDGRAGLEGRPKPLCYGRVFHIEPVLVDPSALLYQVHDGAIEDVDAVYDTGVPLTKVSGPPSAGQYAVNTGQGTFTLGAGSAGQITADVRGDKLDGSYVELVGSIVQRVVGTRSDLSDPDDFDIPSFQAMAAVTAPVGIFSADEINILDLLDQVVAGVGAHFGFNRAGKLTIDRIAAPVEPALFAFSEQEILEIERVAVSLPAWRRKIGYRKYWTVIGPDGVAGVVDEETRADLAESFRYSVADDPSIKTRHPLSEEIVDETSLALKVDAETEASRRLAIFGADRDAFRVRLKTQPYALELGQSIRITYPRYRLGTGRLLVVVGMTEDAAVNEVTLDLWG